MLIVWIHYRHKTSESRGALLHNLYSSVVFYFFSGHQEDSNQSKEREWEQYPPSFQEGPWKIRLIWRSFKEHQAPQLRRGASEQVKGERLRLHRCEVGALTLSLVLFINLFHPWRASPDPHSSQREVVAFLPLLILRHHTTCTYLNQVSSGATKVREPQAQTFSLSFAFKARGKQHTRPFSFYIHFKRIILPMHHSFLLLNREHLFLLRRLCKPTVMPPMGLWATFLKRVALHPSPSWLFEAEMRVELQNTSWYAENLMTHSTSDLSTTR